MAVINMGPATIDLPSTFSAGATLLNTTNPASADGTLTSCDIKITGLTAVSCKVGTFYNTGGDNYVVRDSQNLGNLAVGTHEDIAIDLEVQTGDLIGFYSASGGQITRATSGYDGIWYDSGDASWSSAQEFVFYDGDAVGIKATGESSDGEEITVGHFIDNEIDNDIDESVDNYVNGGEKPR